MKTEIEQFAKNNNMEVAQVYFLFEPVVGFTLFLYLSAFSLTYSIVAVFSLAASYMLAKFLISLKDSAKVLFELALTKPASQN